MTNRVYIPGSVVQLTFERDGVPYEVTVYPDAIRLRGGLVFTWFSLGWVNRLTHPWTWGQPIGGIAERLVDRCHRAHQRLDARTRELEEWMRDGKGNNIHGE